MSPEQIAYERLCLNLVRVAHNASGAPSMSRPCRVTHIDLQDGRCAVDLHELWAEVERVAAAAHLHGNDPELDP